MKKNYLTKNAKNLSVIFGMSTTKKKILSYVTFLDIGRKPNYNACLLTPLEANRIAWKRLGRQIRRVMVERGRR